MQFAAVPHARHPRCYAVRSPRVACSSTWTDGKLVADAETPVTTPFVLNPGALTGGAKPGSPVTTDYPSPFRFTGTLHEVVVDVSGELIADTDSEMRMAMARQ